MTAHVLHLLGELQRRAGLEALPAASGRYMAIMFGDHLVSVLISDDDVLSLIATVTVPPGREAAVLRRGLAERRRRPVGGRTSIGYDAEARSLVVRCIIAAEGMHYPAFEQCLTEFAELCERLAKPAPVAADPAPSEFAIYA